MFELNIQSTKYPGLILIDSATPDGTFWQLHLSLDGELIQGSLDYLSDQGDITVLPSEGLARMLSSDDCRAMVLEAITMSQESIGCWIFSMKLPSDVLSLVK